ncbi:MAG: TonB-dependent receptor, partial [Vicinamibacterales bacterium]
FPSGLRAVYRNGVPDSVNTYNTPVTILQDVVEHGLFVQDRWTPARKLTLNLGIRVDRTTSQQAASCQVETIFIVGRCFDAVEKIPDWLDVAPRVAAIYDLFGDGRTAIKFGANRYMVGIGSGTIDLVNPIRVTSDTRPWADRNGDLIPQLTELGPSTGFNLGTTNRYQPGFERPYAAEYSVEFEQQLMRDVVFSVAYFNRRFRRTIGSRNLAVPTAGYVPLQVTEVTSGRPVTVYNQDPTTRGRFDVLWDNAAELNRDFNGVDLNVNKRFDGRWMMIAGLSLGRNIGDIYGTADLNNPNFTFRRGRFGNDVPVAAKVSASYQLPYQVMLSGVAQHYTGFPETTTVVVSNATTTLTQVTQSIVVEPRATTRLPSVNLVDLTVKRAFKLDRVRIQPALDLFNIFNSNAIQARTTVLGPAYRRASNIVFGRMVKFAVNVDF